MHIYEGGGPGWGGAAGLKLNESQLGTCLNCSSSANVDTHAGSKSINKATFPSS